MQDFVTCHMWWDWFSPFLKMIYDHWSQLYICSWRWRCVVRAVYLSLKGWWVVRTVYLLLVMMRCSESCISVTEDDDLWWGESCIYLLLKMMICGESCASATEDDDLWWELCICYWRLWCVVRAVYLLLKMMMCGESWVSATEDDDVLWELYTW